MTPEQESQLIDSIMIEMNYQFSERPIKNEVTRIIKKTIEKMEALHA